ncbi:MAG: hypothetical protein M3081_14600 [Gemmatimonadota bacterium]|nr:hypothetical protein [Gemmatimonadota bacterium]
MVALVAIVTTGSVISVFIVSVTRIWLKLRDRKPLPDTRLDAIEERLGDVQRSIDAVAIEMERVSEGQRFTVKLLADRAERGLVPRSVERIKTPH